MFLGFALSACSSNPPAASPATTDDTASGTDSTGCECKVSGDDSSTTLACGKSTCFEQRKYTCSANGTLKKGASCGASTAEDGGSDSGSEPQPLSCLSHTWCKAGTVTHWNGISAGANAGGEIKDGLYRLAYTFSSKGTGTTKGEAGSAYLFQDGRIRGFSAGGTGFIGTYKIADTKIVIKQESRCDDATGAELSASAEPSLTFFATDSELRIITLRVTGDGSSESFVKVYQRRTSLCGGLPSSAPASPGDSFVCSGAKCGCAEAENAPADATVCASLK